MRHRQETHHKNRQDVARQTAHQNLHEAKLSIQTMAEHLDRRPPGWPTAAAELNHAFAALDGAALTIRTQAAKKKCTK